MQSDTTNFADTLGHRIGHGEKLVGLFIEEEMIIAKMRAAHVPVEIFCLHIDGEDIGEKRVHRAGNVFRRFRGKIGSLMPMSYECADIDATYVELKKRGVEFEGPPEKQPWGTYAMFKDSEGNRFVLSANGK